MPPKDKWGDFAYAGIVKKKGKHGSKDDEAYDTWTCPHCGECAEALVSPQNRKALACSNHFWNKKTPCPKRPDTDVRGQPKPATPSAPPIEVPKTHETPAPVIGEPVMADATLKALNEELVRVKIEREKATTEAQQATARAQQAEARYNEERIISERRKRERSDAYSDAGLRDLSPHSSDGEEEKATKRKKFQAAMKCTKQERTSTAQPSQSKRGSTTNIHSNLEENLKRSSDAEDMKAHRKTAPASTTEGDRFFKHYKTVLEQSPFATKKAFEGFHPDKHVGSTKRSAKAVHKVIKVYKSKHDESAKQG